LGDQEKRKIQPGLKGRGNEERFLKEKQGKVKKKKKKEKKAPEKKK